MRRFIPIVTNGLAALIIVLAAGGCAEKVSPRVTPSVAEQAPSPAPAPPPAPVSPAPPPAPPVQPRVPVYRQAGIASWYGGDFQGRKTASGEVFDMVTPSAAHRTLPLGTEIRVTNLNNSKSITVRVNDRGPFIANRILELSYAAARSLGFSAEGTARVSIEADEIRGSASHFAVQAAVFSEQESANLLKDRLSGKYEHISIQPFVSNTGKFYRVRVGSYSTEERAAAVAAKLKLEGLEPFVVRKD